METAQQMEMSNCYSKELQDLVYRFLKKWDVTISTLDDLDAQKVLKNKLNRSMSIITSIQNKSNEKAVNNAKNKNEVVKLLLENQNKKWYKDLTLIYDDLQYIMYTINSLYELKNRKSHDNIALRYELSKLKQELK